MPDEFFMTDQLTFDAVPSQSNTKPSDHPATIYCDGACSGNPGPGGWGCIVEINGERREFSGGAPHTTNNQMEMQAFIDLFWQGLRPEKPARAKLRK